jgi:signal transduction histidine kinase
VSGRRVADGWQITVSDDGIGVAPSHLERIFETYERPRTGLAGGSGLGLGICRSIVERHRGRIAVEAVPGGGSRFTFFLPDPAPAAEAPGRA